MQEKTREDILTQLKALMAKTTVNGCTEAEAFAAANIAARLMAKWQIESADIMVESEENTTVNVPFKYGKAEPWELILMRAIGKFASVFGSYSSDYVKFWGRKRDVEVAAYYFEEMSNRIAKDAQYNFRSNNPTGVSYKTYLRSYRLGFVNGLHGKIVDSQRQEAAVHGDASKALMVIENRGKAAEEFARSTGFFRTSRSRGSSVAGSAYAIGADHGRRASIVQGIPSPVKAR